MFKSTAVAIGNSQLSHALQGISWVVPVSQSTHIASLSVLFACVLLIDLRLLGVGASSRTVSQLTAALSPWIWRALGLLVFTGVLQTIIEPVRQFITPIYWLKLAMVLVLALLTAWFVRTLRANAARWDEPATRPAGARAFAIVSLAGWTTVVILGRFIGYVWASYL